MSLVWQSWVSAAGSFPLSSALVILGKLFALLCILLSLFVLALSQG